MGMLTGSLRGLMVDSIPYDVVSESEAKITSPAETTSARTTGGALISVELKNSDVEGIEVDCSDPAVYSALLAVQISGKLVPLSFEWAGGQVFSAPSGTISVGELSTKTGRAEIKLIPNGDWLKA